MRTINQKVEDFRRFIYRNSDSSLVNFIANINSIYLVFSSNNLLVINEAISKLKYY